MEKLLRIFKSCNIDLLDHDSRAYRSAMSTLFTATEKRIEWSSTTDSTNLDWFTNQAGFTIQNCDHREDKCHFCGKTMPISFRLTFTEKDTGLKTRLNGGSYCTAYFIFRFGNLMLPEYFITHIQKLRVIDRSDEINEVAREYYKAARWLDQSESAYEKNRNDLERWVRTVNDQIKPFMHCFKPDNDVIFDGYTNENFSKYDQLCLAKFMSVKYMREEEEEEKDPEVIEITDSETSRTRSIDEYSEDEEEKKQEEEPDEETVSEENFVVDDDVIEYREPEGKTEVEQLEEAGEYNDNKNQRAIDCQNRLEDFEKAYNKEYGRKRVRKVIISDDEENDEPVTKRLKSSPVVPVSDNDDEADPDFNEEKDNDESSDEEEGEEEDNNLKEENKKLREERDKYRDERNRYYEALKKLKEQHNLLTSLLFK